MNLIQYLKDSRAELTKVVWPSRKQTRDHSILVIVISLAVAALIGVIDLIIEQGIIKQLLGL